MAGYHRKTAIRLLGEEAALSARTVARLKTKWQAELEAWRQRPLIDLEVVYLWVDGLYVKAGLEKEKAALLVALAALSNGHKVVVAVTPRYRESSASWSEVLRDLKRRGMNCPCLVAGDGHLGIWKGEFLAWCRQRGHEAAAQNLERDWEPLVTFYRFPKEYWQHLRTTNPVESPFAALRLRTDAAKRYKRVDRATAVIWKMLMVAEQRFRRLKGSPLGAGYEIKAWYALYTELTGRFRESNNLLAGKQFRVATIDWMVSSVVFGTPRILGVLTVEAASVAEQRDRHYHKPPYYLAVEPGDTTAMTRNLQQTNVNGYRIQEQDQERLAEAAEFARNHRGWDATAHTVEAQELNRALVSRFSYRLDTNFAKVDRINHPDIEKFKNEVLHKRDLGHTVADWIRILRDLQSGDDKAQARSLTIIRSPYNEA